MSPISILHLEDSSLDAELAAARLQKSGLDYHVTRIETRDDFIVALESGYYDLILADYTLPCFDGATALALARETLPHIPFIFVSGNLGEEVAIDTLKQGATDYVLKQRLDKLVPAVERALTEARERAQRLDMEAELRLRHEEIQQLNEHLQRAMTETHHRVKNNLQVIAAMIDMQTMEAKEMVSVCEFKRLGHQVQTLAMVHDVLTHKAKKDGTAHTVDAQELLARLVRLLCNLATPHKICLEVSHSAVLTARQGTAIALALNELVSNAIKHGDSDVIVTFDVERLDEWERAVLCVRDFGDGFSPDFNATAMANTGLELIESLARWDLGGSIHYDNHPEGGGLATILIPLSAV